VHSQALRNRVATLALFRVAALGSSVFFDIKSYILPVNSWAFFQDLFLLVNVL
jgi:hypothetical protein